jgi:hypothetical protein
MVRPILALEEALSTSAKEPARGWSPAGSSRCERKPFVAWGGVVGSGIPALTACAPRIWAVWCGRLLVVLGGVVGWASQRLLRARLGFGWCGGLGIPALTACAPRILAVVVWTAVGGSGWCGALGVPALTACAPPGSHGLKERKRSPGLRNVLPSPPDPLSRLLSSRERGSSGRVFAWTNDADSHELGLSTSLRPTPEEAPRTWVVVR